MFIDKKSNGSYYDVLMVDPRASDLEIKQAYQKLYDIYHPEKTSMNKRIAALRFRLINEAYAALRCEAGRARYNRLLLTRAGKPRGLNLAADNDNYNAKEKKIRDMLAGLMKPRGRFDDLSVQNLPEDEFVVTLDEKENKKDREHG